MIDIEDENVLKTIFKDKFPETWRENPDVSQYLKELSACSLDRINKEPELLAEEKEAILEQTEDLVYHNYKTFIQTANCSREIFKDFNLVEQHLVAVDTQLPDFIEKCQAFSKTSQDIITSRRLNSLTLSRHTQLLEILELPQLMETCVRNGYYDEALDLSKYVDHLEKKFSSIQLISTIASDVQAFLRLMLVQLVDQLRTNVQLPQCLKVVSYLRRMDVFTEEELRIKFLHARDSWFLSILADIPSNDCYEHITKVIVVSRVHLFDIITQYRAIFSDDPDLTTTIQSSKDDMSWSRAAILYNWVFRKITLFLGTLEKDLESPDISGRMDSVLNQSMYFGLSFGRVGADFRSQLVPIFVKATLRNFHAAIDEVTNTFQESMSSYVLASTPTVMISSALEASTSQQDKLHPPLSLMEFTPLASLCNGLLTVFNVLRLLAPVSIVSDVRAKLMECLLLCAKTINDFHRTEEGSMITREKETFLRFCKYFARKLVPYINICFNALFPPQQLAQILGLSLAEFGKIKNLNQLDVDAIIEPISHLFPKEENMEINVDLELKSVETVVKTEDSPIETSNVLEGLSEASAVIAKNHQEPQLQSSDHLKDQEPQLHSTIQFKVDVEDAVEDENVIGTIDEPPLCSDSNILSTDKELVQNRE